MGVVSNKGVVLLIENVILPAWNFRDIVGSSEKKTFSSFFIMYPTENIKESVKLLNKLHEEIPESSLTS